VALVEHTEQLHSDAWRETRRIVTILAGSIHERDLVTYEHSRRVATYAQRLARAVGWPRSLAYDLALGALVHDLGKTWIVNEVLLKPSPLSSREREEMERHPVIGARMLEMFGASPFVVDAVLHHHETYDGRGYPDHLAGERIPLAARLLAVADVFDALTSDRPYRPALESAEACERLRAGSGTYFDPELVAAFLELVAAWPDFALPRRTCPVPPRPLGRRRLWAHDLIGEEVGG
jgi:putative two-component system response regulator